MMRSVDVPIPSAGDLARKARTLRALHVRGRPLVLPNAWDVASAQRVEAAGFPAVATASAAIAPTLGFADGEAIPADDMLAAVARIAVAVSVPVTADFGAGYDMRGDEIAARLVTAGVVGCNLEDTDHARGGLVDRGGGCWLRSVPTRG